MGQVGCDGGGKTKCRGDILQAIDWLCKSRDLWRQAFLSSILISKECELTCIQFVASLGLEVILYL